MKWLNNIRAKKCAEAGHIEKTITRKIRKDGSPYYAVIDYVQDKIICKRCRITIRDWDNQKEVDCFNSCSMSSEHWEEMREKGFIKMYD